MDRLDYSPHEPIAALSTPWGQSALALVRVSGAGSLGLLAALFEPASALGSASGHAAVHGRLRDPAAGGSSIDEVLVIVYRAPRSFTGEESAEICTHGSPLIVGRVLELLSRAGFRPAGPGEFTLRAFLNGRLDLTQAEAVNEIVRARTDRARALALHRLAGSVEGKDPGAEGTPARACRPPWKCAWTIRRRSFPASWPRPRRWTDWKRSWRGWPPPTASGACTRKG